MGRRLALLVATYQYQDLATASKDQTVRLWSTTNYLSGQPR